MTPDKIKRLAVAFLKSVALLGIIAIAPMIFLELVSRYPKPYYIGAWVCIVVGLSYFLTKEFYRDE